MMLFSTQKGVFAAGDDIDNGIADAQDIKTAHGIFLQTACGPVRSRASWQISGVCKTPTKRDKYHHHVFPDGSSRRLSS
jgi:hypothetical protein